MQIRIRHNFETAHRLPFLEGKCQSIHGHSWWVEWAFEAPMDQNSLTINFSDVKKELRGWVDTYLDHGAMLGIRDPFLPVLRDFDSKVYTFGDQGNIWTSDLKWPTVEAVAVLLTRVAIDNIANPYGIEIVETEVTEKYDNKARWTKGKDL